MENIIQLKHLPKRELELSELRNKLQKIEFQLLKLSASLLAKKNSQIKISNADGIHFLDYSSIIQIKADGNYSRIVLENAPSIMVSKTLKYLANILPGATFIRTHQSHLININQISQITRKGGLQIKLKDGRIIPVSRTERNNLLEALELNTLA